MTETAPPPPAAPAVPPTPSADSLALARRLVALALEKRAEDPVLLDVRTLVDYTDFFLILTGTSSRQNQAVGEHLVRTMKAEGHRPLSKAGLDTGSWICIDLGDVVVHVFDPETRARYDLELLWADAPRAELVAPAAVPADEKPARRRRAVRKAAVADADAANAPDSERPPEDEPDLDESAPRAPKPRKPTAKKKASPSTKASRPASKGRAAAAREPAARKRRRKT